jgi:hypothetical protein
MSSNSPYGDRQVFVTGRLKFVEILVASVDIFVRLRPARRRDAACRHRQVRIRRGLALKKVYVTDAMVIIMFVSIGRARLLGHLSSRDAG